MAHQGVNMNLKVGMTAKGDFNDFNNKFKAATSSINTFTTKLGGAKKAFMALTSVLAGGAVIHKLATDLQAISGITIPSFASLVEESIQVSNNFADAEAKLKALLRNTKSITDPTGAARRLINLTASTEAGGVVAQEVLESGLQQLSTFQLSENSLTMLTEGMANLLAQQYGTSASQSDAVNVANMIGKGMTGMTGALTRVGIIMDDQQKQLIQNGDEQTRLNTMVQVLQSNVGGVNEYLANYTAAGKEANFQFQIAAMMREWGDKFMEMRIQILDTIRPYLPVLKRIMDAVIGVLGKVVSGAAQWIAAHGNEIIGFGERIAVKVEEFAAKVTPQKIEDWITSMADNITAILDILKKIAIGLAVTSLWSGVAGFAQGFRLRPKLPANISSPSAIGRLSSSEMALFNTLNAMRNSGGASGLGSTLGAWAGKTFGIPMGIGRATAVRGVTQYTAAIGPQMNTIAGASSVTAGVKLTGYLRIIAGALRVFTTGAFVALIAAGLNKFIKSLGGGEKVGSFIAGLIVKGIKLIMDSFGAKTLPDLLLKVGMNIVELIFKTIPEMLWGFFKTLVLGIKDAIFGTNSSGLFSDDDTPGVSISALHQSALGTPYSHGTTTINERGGEIMRLPSGTTIIPADKSASMLSGNNVTVNLTIQGNVLSNTQYMDETCDYLTSKLRMALVAG